jgi:thioredoxin reductase
MDGTVLVDPSHEDLMAILGLPSALGTRACDVAIIGAGPAGLAAAVYAASEGLGTVILEPDLLGGQAGTSSLIRNYLGFPRGLSGEDLTSRAVDQAWLFGASFTLGAADGLTVDGASRVVHAAGGRVEARAVVIATGVTWRRLGVPELETVPAAALFVMIGAEPRTTWLPGAIDRDDQGFIRTGRDLHRASERPPGWPLKRPPLLLETSVPGVFAAGDVRHRSIKRVASAAGEGATAIHLVHEFLSAEQG